MAWLILSLAPLMVRTSRLHLLDVEEVALRYADTLSRSLERFPGVVLGHARARLQPPLQAHLDFCLASRKADFRTSWLHDAQLARE
jgi:hypothetical protein